MKVIQEIPLPTVPFSPQYASHVPHFHVVRLKPIYICIACLGINKYCLNQYQSKFSRFDSEFGDVYEQAAASAPRDMIVMSRETFEKSGFDNDISHCYEEEFTLPFCHLGVTSGRDCAESIPRERWFSASWGQLFF